MVCDDYVKGLSHLNKQMLTILYNLLEVVIVLVPILLAVAFMTIIERKTLAAMQRRVGPNKVGYYGVLQPFSERHLS